MAKFFIFMILFRLIGNPIIALIVLFAIIYLLDRRYVGVLPSMTKPFRRGRNISRLRSLIAINSFDASAKRDLARLLIERRKFQEAYDLLLAIQPSSQNSAEFWDDLGTALIGLGQLEQGEEHILRALSLNHRVRYGQPYLRLAMAWKERDPHKALNYTEKFKEIQSSSSEAYYLLGTLYLSINQKEKARQAFDESISLYRTLPKYKKRQERKWSVKSQFKRLTM